MLMDISEIVNKGRWRMCCKCGSDGPKIRKNEFYYQEYLSGGGSAGYQNFCVRCAVEEFQERIQFLQKKLKSIKIYTKVKEK